MYDTYKVLTERGDLVAVYHRKMDAVERCTPIRGAYVIDTRGTVVFETERLKRY